MMTERKYLPTLRATLAACATVSAIVLCASAAEAKVGVAAAVNTDARGKAPGQQQRVITLGQTIIFDEEIATDAKGLVQVLLLDGTTFTVGPNSRLKIDKFVYNPDSGDATVVATLTKGTFRFIGGQTSRKPGGATINTPVGTIGIRGAMVEGSVTSSRSALFSMIFGSEVRFIGPGGVTAKIFKPGYTLTVLDGAGGLQTDVRPRTQGDATTFQTALAGTTGKSGGAENKPDDDTVAQSDIVVVNSGLPNTGPIPTSRPSPVQSTGISNVEDNVADFDILTEQQVNQSIVEGGATAARVLTAPAVYSAFGENFGQAGERGLVGSTAATDRVVALSRQGGRLVSTEAGINLPDMTGTLGDNGLAGFQVQGSSAAGPVSGSAYAGAGDFAAYLLGINGDPKRPFYLITGTGTPDARLDTLFSGNRVREYALTVDPIRRSKAPFFAPDLFGPLTNLNASNLYIVESNTGGSFDTKVFQSWVDIQGVGASQKSAIGLLTSAIAPDADGDPGIGAARSGSFRYDPVQGPVNMRGGIGTLAGPGGAHLFGPDVNNFVLGPSLDPVSGFSDEFLSPSPLTGRNGDGYGGDGFFGTHHVADLVSTTPKASLGRTSRHVSGFITGLAESSAEGTDNPYILSSIVQPNLQLATDATSNSIRATAQVFDLLDENPVAAGYLLTFGPASGSGGANAFVDDDRFGAVANDDNARTRLVTDGGKSIANATGDKPGSYIVSGRANPIAGYQHCTSCDFIDWGWWGTRVRVAADGTEIPDPRSDHVHMGTWVAGDITNPADLPNNISATYSGTALGNVARQTSGGVAKYIARGDMDMSYDFNSRSGTLQISNFDGMNVSGSIVDSSTSNQALFLGPLQGSGATGVVQGAFVNNGRSIAAGVIGDFEFGKAGYRAAGTVAGRRN